MKVPVRPIMTTAATSVPAAMDPYRLDDAMLAPFVVISLPDATALHNHSTQLLHCTASVQSNRRWPEGSKVIQQLKSTTLYSQAVPEGLANELLFLLTSTKRGRSYPGSVPLSVVAVGAGGLLAAAGVATGVDACGMDCAEVLLVAPLRPLEADGAIAGATLGACAGPTCSKDQ